MIVVPLLSQEGLTCRLLPGAAAPYPALDQVPVMFLSAPARNCFDFVDGRVVVVEDP